MRTHWILSRFLLATMMTSGVPVWANPPKNQEFLGAASYKTMPLYRLKEAKLLYANEELLHEKGIPLSEVLTRFAFASPVDGEVGGGYLPESKTAHIDGNGGSGLNNNFGSGRAAIIEEEWQTKGSGKTMMVNPATDDGHRNGASVAAEGIHEATWSNLLAAELPYGAFRILAVIATGSTVNSGGHKDQPRVLIIREDPLRPGHYVINSSAEELNDPWDRTRISEAMKRIVEALPQPEGQVVPADRAKKFRRGIFEFIDRQAIQHSYAWAHSLFHGGTSPTNTGVDGRALDFGTQSAFDGYPRARLLSDDGFMGETQIYKRDLLNDLRESWVKTLPEDLKAALPTKREWFTRFDRTFEKNQRTEMLRLAGVFTEFTKQIEESPEGRNFAKTLIQIAMAGNDR